MIRLTKKHIKIMIAVAFVCLVAVVGSIIFFKTKSNDAYITKKQWMEKLASMEYFQSSYYVEDEGDEIATGEFIALTSMEMIGETRLNIYMRNIGKSEYDDKDTLFVDASDAFDFIKKDSLDKKISGDEIETLFSDFEIIYNEDSWVDDFVEITYSDSLIAIGDENIVSCDDSLSILKVSDVSEYKAGDVIGFTDPNTHYPTVRKIESISEDGTLAISEDVDISDVIVDATCSDIEEISLDNMLLSGYEEIPSNNATAETMSLRDGISSKGFKVHVACEDGDTTVEIEDKDSGKTYKSPVMSSQNDDSDYDVTIDVSGMYTKACWEYKWKEGFTYAEVNLIDTVSVSSQIGSVDIVDKKIKIFDSAIPIADGVLWVEFEFYIVFDAEGNVSLEMTVPMNVQGVWSKDGGLKTTKQASGEATADLTGDINGNIMLRSEAVLSLFYLIDLIDAEVDVGANVKAEETIRSTCMICADVSIYCPIVKVSVCGDQNEKKKTYRSLIGTIMDNSISYDIIDEDNAPQYRMFHYELINGVGKEVDECTYGKDEEQATELPEMTEKTTTEIDGQNYSELDVYEILRQVHDYPMYFLVNSLPDGQENCLGYPYAVTENGDRYVVTGTIKALDVILKDTGIENMEEGDKVTSVLGTEYTVTYNDHANNGNWIGIDMKDLDGNVYHIKSGLSGTALTSSYVSVQDDNGTDVVKTYENTSFEVCDWSPLIFPCSVTIPDIGGKDSTGYQGIYMADDGEIYSHDEANSGSASTVYDENGNVIAD
jgi:hypothetical protein